MKAQDIRKRVGDLRQFASVRRVTFDDGPERGVRGLAFSSGGGLDFWVLSDRSMDIGPLSWKGNPIAWQSVTGYRAGALIDLDADEGRGFMRGFAGMLVTCGLDHVGQAKPGHPLHGQLPYTPSRVVAYGEDWERDEPVLYCEGEVDQVRHLGEAIRLRRRIEVPIGQALMRIRDKVTNFGAEPQEHQILYHINMGWPALTDGSVVSLGGKDIVRPFMLVPEGGARSSEAFDPGPGPIARCSLSFPDLDGRMHVDFTVDTLPTLKIYKDPRPCAHVLSIEPCTVPRPDDPRTTSPIILQPGETRAYGVDISFEAVQPKAP